MTATPRRVVTGPTFRRVALASFISMIVIVLSGAAVRLTGSGLGCPDWPTCFKGRITGSWGIHHFIEYGKRVWIRTGRTHQDEQEVLLWDYDGYRYTNTNNAAFFSVLTDNMKKGDFSPAGIPPIYDRATGSSFRTTACRT